MRKLGSILAGLALLTGTYVMPVTAGESALNECYIVDVHGGIGAWYYNTRTDQWFTPDGELLVVEQEPVMEAVHAGETVYVDITTLTVYTADNEVHQELTDILPKMLEHVSVSCSGLPRDLNITFPIVYDFVEDASGFYFHYAFATDDNTLGGISYTPDDEYYEIFPWQNAGDYSAEVYTTMGDITADGAVTIADAITLSRYVSEDTTLALTPLQQSLADVDADGYVLADDVTAVLRTLAGLTT